METVLHVVIIAAVIGFWPALIVYNVRAQRRDDRKRGFVRTPDPNKFDEGSWGP